MTQLNVKVALNLGSCADATIKFANGLDGRTEPAFEPTDPGSFSHGSALGIGVITSFICQQLNDKCKAPAGAFLSQQYHATKILIRIHLQLQSLRVTLAQLQQRNRRVKQLLMLSTLLSLEVEVLLPLHLDPQQIVAPP
jgi:hypothetical protein